MTKPFIKWCGGKSNSISEIAPLIPSQFTNYHEPFLGGGALFWYLAKNNILDNKIARLTDINENLINCYQVLKQHYEFLSDNLFNLQKIYNSSDNPKELYYKIRKRYNDPLSNKTDLACNFIFLNKTCYNGVHRENKDGEFNVPFGKFKNPTIYDEQNLLECSETLNRIKTEIYRQDFTQILSYAKPNDFVYFDPPYLPISKTSNFTRYTYDDFKLANHIKLRDIASELKKRCVKILISNSNNPEIISLYKYNFTIKEIQSKRSVNSNIESRGKIAELLIQ